MADIKKIGVLTSGGDASGMNPTIRSVVRTSIANGLEVVGIKEGYQGLMYNDVYTMTAGSVGGIINQGEQVMRMPVCYIPLWSLDGFLPWVSALTYSQQRTISSKVK